MEYLGEYPDVASFVFIMSVACNWIQFIIYFSDIHVHASKIEHIFMSRIYLMKV